MTPDAVTTAARTTALCVAVYTAGIVGHVMEAPIIWMLGGVGVALLLVVTGTHAGLSGGYIAWRSGCVAAGSVWCAMATSPNYPPWSVGMSVAAMVVSLTVLMVTPVIAATKDGPGMLGRLLGGRELEWHNRIKRISKTDVEPLKVTDWDSGYGYDVAGEFPEGGSTWDDLAAKSARFGSDLRLPDGCAVEVTQGPHQGAFVISVNKKSAFAVEADMPLDMAAGSIYDPCPIGPYADGTIAELKDLRQESVLLAGATGSGKSNGARVLTCWHVTRRDQVTYIIDLSSGRLGKPFIRAYLKGEVDRPAIDGLADTEDRARALLVWLRDVAMDRAHRYDDLIIASDDDKLPVSPDVPAIRVVIDEPKLIWANPKLRDITEQLVALQETTRAMGIRFDYTALAGTIGTLPIELKRQIRHRIAFRAADIAEVAYILDWAAAKALSFRSLMTAGMVYLGSIEGPAPRLARYWRVKPSGIDVVARRAADIRPSLDAAATSLPSYKAIIDRWDWQRRPDREHAMTAPAPQPEDANGEFNAAQKNLADVHARLKRINAEREQETESATFDALAASAEPDPVRATVMEYLSAHGESATGDIITHLQQGEHAQTRQTLQTKISTMADDRVIVRSGRGRYHLPNEGD